VIEMEVTEYRYHRQRPPGGFPSYDIRIVRMGVGGDRWAVRSCGERLIRHGKSTRWVYEPRPSERSDAWIRRATFTLAEAVAAIERRIAQDAMNAGAASKVAP